MTDYGMRPGCGAGCGTQRKPRTARATAAYRPEDTYHRDATSLAAHLAAAGAEDATQRRHLWIAHRVPAAQLDQQPAAALGALHVACHATNPALIGGAR